MKNVSEIINQGNKNAELPAWLNMRHAWSASDAKRDEGLIYPNNVIQIKNLDYKKEPDHQKWCEAVELLASQRTMGEKTSEKYSRIFYYNEPDDASNLDSERYASNSLFDIYYPAEPDAQTSYPVIVSVHGGGWFYGDKELYSYYCCHLASKGFAVVNFNYRLAPQNKYPAAIEDVAYLIRYIHENAGVLHLDMEKFYMLGDSAGAQLTANYCIIAGNAAYRSKLDFFTYDRLPKAVCLNCGAYEMDKREDNISDWYMKKEGRTEAYPALEDPGVKSVRRIYGYYKKNGIQTIVMGASFRSVEEVLGLAGCDKLTIAPTLLHQLKDAKEEVSQERWNEL